jgi:tripartite-type tricarboxylate transporter receptor subunit TctC
MFADALGSMPHIQSGKLRALAVASVNRFPATPDLPTIQEAGVKGFSVSGWTILLAPAGVPKPIIDRINREVVRILPMADVKDKLAGDGSEFGKNTPEQAAAIAQVADGVVVGSAIVEIVGKHGADAAAYVETYVRSLAEAVHAKEVA